MALFVGIETEFECEIADKVEVLLPGMLVPTLVMVAVLGTVIVDVVTVVVDNRSDSPTSRNCTRSPAITRRSCWRRK